MQSEGPRDAGDGLSNRKLHATAQGRAQAALNRLRPWLGADDV